jgi:hypothetical protein
MTEQRPPWVEEELRREEMRQQRQQWEERRRAEAEQRRREALQEELAGYLRRRGRDWADVTGSTPGAEQLQRWQEEFVNEKEREYQAERASKLKAAEAEYNF